VARLVAKARPKVAVMGAPTTVDNGIGGGQFTDFFSIGQI
jgi:hypothetical protein